MTLKANPRLDRQLSLAGPMVLWRDRAGGGRAGLLLTTSACLNPACTDRHIDVGVTKVDDSLVSASCCLRRAS